MTRDADQRWMARALELAERGVETTDPNPAVGCVLVAGGKVVGEGWHERAGGPHAERMALDAAGDAAAGATAYVTLEPCGHTGRTPPCVDALIDARVARVVYAVDDADPRTAGQSTARLEAAGVAVSRGVCSAQARDLNRGFFSRHSRGRPWITLKLAMSLDGRTAMASGESQWITGEAARADVHRWRARASAVLTGIGTVLADNPRLTARQPSAASRQPMRVVLDSRLRTPADAALIGDDTLVLVGAQVDTARTAGFPATVRAVPGADGRIDLHAAAALLATEFEVNELLIECGPALAGAWLDSGLVDQVLIYTAPMLLGDAARGLAHLPGVERLDQAIVLEDAQWQQIGRDWRIIARPVLAGPAPA